MSILVTQELALLPGAQNKFLLKNDTDVYLVNKDNYDIEHIVLEDWSSILKINLFKIFGGL